MPHNGIAMSGNMNKAIRHKRTTNIGDWMASKIYSDVKNNTCSCGGKFSKFIEEDGKNLPVCDSCHEPPPLYRIRAQVKDRYGDIKYITVRHSQNGKRLTKPFHCLTLLETIDEELEAGVFDISKYGSKKMKESYKFKNFAKSYLEHNQRRLERGEITPYGMKGKKKYVKILVEHDIFKNLELRQIRPLHISDFRDSFTEKFSNRDMALGELKTMLKFAKEKNMIQDIPEFGKIETSQKRDQVLTIDQARAIIPHIENPMYRLMITLMSEYALRPCEVRAIQFRDISLAKDMIIIQRHFSSNKLLGGRKSNKKGQNSYLTFPLIAELKNWVIDQATPLDSEDFIFKSPNGNPVFENTLPKAWSRTLKKLGLPHVQMYEIRHARGTEVLELANGNFSDVKNFLGHSNVSTTEKRYARPVVKNEKFFIKKDADVIEFKA